MFKSFVYLFFPVPVIIDLGLIGLVFLWFTKKQRLGKCVVTLSCLLLVLLSNRYIANALLKSLEDKYPPIQNASSLLKTHNNIKYVIVFSGLLNYNDKLPIISQMSSTMMVRLLEGIRLYKEIPNLKLILSGGGRYPISEAEVMGQIAVTLGVDRNDIMLETKSSKTYDEVILLKEMVKNDGFILVTSAAHMPRSVALFRKAGMDPVPAPTDYIVRNDSEYYADSFIPSSKYLVQSHKVFYEYLGFLKEYILGRL